MNNGIKRIISVIAFACISISGCVNQNTSTPAVTIEATSTVPVAATAEPTLALGPEIHEIQGSSHTSPLLGKKVENVQGIVTTFRGDGFYMQSLNPDNDVSTSEGILVFTQLPPRVRPGAIVLVTGVVSEIYPGGIETGNLSITQLTSPKVTEISKDNPLPQPIILGEGGLLPPTMIVDNDRMREFQPTEDGIDFYESLENMLVQINDAVVVGATNAYKEIVVVGDGGNNASMMNNRGSLVLRADDYNPERIILDDSLRSIPNANIGDRFDQPVIGIVDYTFGNFKIQPIVKLAVVPGGIEQETARAAAENELSIASYNVENLDARDNQERFDTVAATIVNHLQSPDIVNLVEIQDNLGAFDDGNADANETYQKIIDTITSIGGPIYQYREITPAVNQDGGEGGGNIRVGFLFRTDRGLEFVDKAGGDARTPVELIETASGVQLSFSPGRIDPGNGAFFESRKPLAGEFIFGGERFIVIGNHLNSKGGDTYLFGDQQPPFLSSEAQRLKQANVLNAFVKEAVAKDPDVKIILLGDLNDFQFSKPISVLLGQEMTDLVNTLPVEEQYTYNYDGNAQVLDHILVTNNLVEMVSEFDIVHINSEFFYETRFSDHDPLLVRFIFE